MTLIEGEMQEIQMLNLIEGEKREIQMLNLILEGKVGNSIVEPDSGGKSGNF